MARAAEWAVVFVLVSIGLFWAATNYSADVGISRARQIVAELPDDPSTVVYSKTSLDLNIPGVRETRCRDGRGAHPYRYAGLALSS